MLLSHHLKYFYDISALLKGGLKKKKKDPPTATGTKQNQTNIQTKKNAKKKKRKNTKTVKTIK